jgi:hypothetical protein
MLKVLLSIFAFSFYASAFAGNYFVATTGSNANAGTLVSPFATIQFALNTSLPGDTVFVRSGAYFEKINWPKSGLSNKNITLKNYGNETVIVNGTGVVGDALLRIQNFSYIEISGLVFQNNYIQDAKGIYIVGEGKNITLKNCTVQNIGWTTNANADPFGVTPNGQAHGIIVNGRTTNGIDSIKIVNCSIHDIITGNSEALTLAGNIDVFELDKDTVYNTKNIGIVAAGHYSWAVDVGVAATLNQSRNGTISNCLVYNNRRFSNTYAPAGIYVDGGANIRVLNNKSYNNGNGISIGCENTGLTARNILVMHNLVYNNDNHGIVFGSNAGIVKKSTVLNNSFFKNGWIQPFTLEINLQNSDSCVIANNIAIPRTNSHYGIGIFGYAASNLTVTNNLLYRYNGYTPDLYVPGTPVQFNAINSFTNDPKFIDTTLANLNLYIQPTSSVINNGTAAFGIPTTKDAAGLYRVVNGAIDIGAYERQDGGCPTLFTITDAQLLMGSFVASQSIQLNRAGITTISNPLLWSSPLINIISPITLNAPLYINAVGCN